MFQLLIYFALFCFIVRCSGNDTTGMSLWDQVVQKEQVFLTVEYQERYLNVWRQDSHGYSRFYVTPLCVMDLNSISCSRNEYSHEHKHVFSFNVKMWDLNAAKVVQLALRQKNMNVQLSDILPLPMQMVRVGLAEKDLMIEINNQWRTNQDQPHIMTFELYARHERFCDKMVTDTQNKTKQFLRNIKPYIEFTMVVGQTASRNFNITGNVLQKSLFFSELVNNHSDINGFVYLRSKDMNRLIHEIYNKVAYEEEISADYIVSDQEKQIKSELFDVFKDSQIQSKDLTKEEWNSVFWDDIFTRPDIQTEYANEVFKYDEDEKHFQWDEEMDRKFRHHIENKHNSNHKSEKGGKAKFHWFGLFKTTGGGKHSSDNYNNEEAREETERNEKDIIKLEDFQKAIDKDYVNVRWNGMKFDQKNFALSRLNTRNLKLSNEIYFKRIIVTKYQTTQQIEIKAESKIQNNESSGQLYLESKCPETWTYYNYTGYCYKVYSSSTWAVAEAQCRSQNAHLASIHSHNENLFIAFLANNSTTNCWWRSQTWIGFSGENGKDFQWSDGTPFDYTSWTPNNPYMWDKHDCGLLWIGKSCNGSSWFVAPTLWENRPCDKSVRYAVCKKATDT